MKVKMVFIVRKDLQMSHGKMSGQCAHAAINVYRSFCKQKESMSYTLDQMYEGAFPMDVCFGCDDAFTTMANLESEWENTGETKIICSTSSLVKLQNLYDKSKLLITPETYDFFISDLIVDQGRTELEENTITCFALFGNSETIDKITKKLQLY